MNYNYLKQMRTVKEPLFRYTVLEMSTLCKYKGKKEQICV